ncbi:MAG: hypothetical protein ACR2M0_10505 [Chloroflexia bacterium]
MWDSISWTTAEDLLLDIGAVLFVTIVAVGFSVYRHHREETAGIVHGQWSARLIPPPEPGPAPPLPAPIPEPPEPSPGPPLPEPAPPAPNPAVPLATR